jgi:hypothetical protein
MPTAQDNCVEVPQWAARHPSPSLTQVILNLLGRAHRRLARVTTGIAQRPALPQQIPALVEFCLDPAQPVMLLGLGDVSVL